MATFIGHIVIAIFLMVGTAMASGAYNTATGRYIFPPVLTSWVVAIVYLVFQLS